MDNPENLATSGTQDIRRKKNKKQQQQQQTHLLSSFKCNNMCYIVVISVPL